MGDELTAMARAMWSLGRYDELIAPRLAAAARALCDAADVRPDVQTDSDAGDLADAPDVEAAAIADDDIDLDVDVEIDIPETENTEA